MPKNKTQGIIFGIIMSYAMAFFWNMFAAAPFSHWLFGKIFPEK